MKDKNISIGIIIGITVIILLIGSLYFIGSEHKGSENNSRDTNDSEDTSTSYISNTTEIFYLPNEHKGGTNPEDMGTSSKVTMTNMPFPERMPNIKVSFEKIPHNTKPVFKVGDKFEYVSVAAVTENPGYDTSEEDNISPSSTSQIPEKTICNVINKERLIGNEYYVVECNHAATMMEGFIMKGEDIYYISTENGEIKRVISNSTLIYKDIEKNMESFSADILSPNSEIYDAVFYSPWMLSLNDDFKMKIEIFQHPTVAKEEITVIDEEKIKNRKCYLVEYRRIDKNNKVILREKEWIDKEKRILIKSEAYLGNLRISTTELVSNIK